jgi:hypothetical protein
VYRMKFPAAKHQIKEKPQRLPGPCVLSRLQCLS